MKPPSSVVIAPTRTPEREQALAEQVLAIWREDMDRQAAARERGWETVKKQTGLRPEAVRRSSGLVIDGSESSVTLPRGGSNVQAGRL